MTSHGNAGVSPYTKIQLGISEVGPADKNYPISFINDPQTGFYQKGSAGTIGMGCNATEVFNATSTQLNCTVYFTETTATGLSGAGSSQSGATALTSVVNNVTTAALNTGVALPSVATAGVGACITIFNNGSNPLKVYGANGSSDTIDGTAGSTGVTLTNANRCQYFATAAATWISAQLGVVSG